MSLPGPDSISGVVPHVVDHPLVADRLGVLRDAATGPAEFRRLAAEIATFLTWEATRHLPTVEIDIAGRIDRARGLRLADPLPLVVPILRAGLGLADAVLAAMGGGDLAIVGIRRDEATLLPDMYCETLPPALVGRGVIVCDPMLATGGSAALACELVADRGAGSITVLTLVAAPEGLVRMESTGLDIIVVCAALDAGLDEHGFIRPGLGDAGDRLFGPRS